MISISMENALVEEYFTMTLVSLGFRLFQNEVVRVSKIYKMSSWPKVGCAFPMVMSSNFRMRKPRDHDHEKDASYFTP